MMPVTNDYSVQWVTFVRARPASPGSCLGLSDNSYRLVLPRKGRGTLRNKRSNKEHEVLFMYNTASVSASRQAIINSVLTRTMADPRNAGFRIH